MAVLLLEVSRADIQLLRGFASLSHGAIHDIILISFIRAEEVAMGQILVRKIDDAALERLKLLAKDRNMPVEALARDALEEVATRPTLLERMASIRLMDEWQTNTPQTDPSSTTLLRALRDGDDRDS